MSIDIFNISWFIIFIFVMLIALIANIIIILAISRDKSMYTSTYFYIINVNIADIILILTCLPERIAAVYYSNGGFHLGMYTCYLLPFLQQVSMQAALGFLLILTVDRCYPAGIPRCLQGDFIRRQIHKHCETLCLIWIFAILINFPLFFLTKYEKPIAMKNENETNHSEEILLASCHTEAREIWSRTYLILLLVLTYLITGIFLVVIYGQVIRIILHSKKYTYTRNRNSDSKQYHFLSPNVMSQDKYRGITTSSTNSSSRTQHQQQQQQQQQRISTNTIRMSMIVPPMSKRKYFTNSHSTQHLQVIIMLFVVILLYILLLLPYRLLNLLYIVYNELFQDSFMNEILFQWLLNIVRLLVFLNCALQPIIYLIISSRLRQTVIKFCQTCWFESYCRCQCLIFGRNRQHFKTDNRAIQAYLSQKYQLTTRSLNQPKNINCRNSIPLSRTPIGIANIPLKFPYTVTFTNPLRR